jgi:glycogen phosphorylase
VAELMRLLVDVHGMDWDPAWDVTRRTFSYTNHTLLPEALERWPLPLFAAVLPRHLEIIYEINRRFIDELTARFPNDPERVARMSLIDEQHPKYVRMAHLAAVGSHTVNGVAALHTRLLKSQVMREFDDYWPGKFVNVTNGVTPRRWLLVSNPRLSALISSRIGDDWLKDLDDLRRLEPLAADAEFRAEWSDASGGAARTGALHRARLGHDCRSVVDVRRAGEADSRIQAPAIAGARHHRDVPADQGRPGGAVTPRTFIFGGKAAPGYEMAKLIIKLIHSVGEVVNHDPDVRGRLKVVFLPDYNVTLGQRVYPAADLSEQISMAGKEASGTGNMKFSMNGALTIGTLDGANVEIREAVGEENFFLFGHTAEEVHRVKEGGTIRAGIYESNEMLRRVIDALVRAGCRAATATCSAR